jgi:hypothetical protein
MASPAPNNDTSSSRQDNLSTSDPQSNSSTSNPQDKSATSTQHIKTVEDLTTCANARQHLPPHREKDKRAPGEARKGHRGPIRITKTGDGVLTEYGEKLEQERLARLAAADEDKEGEPACE